MSKTIELGNMKILPGTKARGKLFVGEFINGVEVYIPFVVINGEQEGPTCWLNSGIHGNEVNGIVANQRIAQELIPKDIKGSVICTIISNPLAFMDKQRETKLDGGNLCEIFPGKEAGTITEKMAYVLFENIRKYADSLIDFHCWGMWHDAKPYAVYKISEDPTVNRITEEMVNSFGAPLVCKLDLTKPLDEPSPLGGALDVQCAAAGIPSFMAECGHSSWLEQNYISYEVKGIKNVLRYLGIIGGEIEKPIRTPIVLTSREILRCKQDGIAILEVEPQQLVKKGERIASIVNAYGDVVDEIIAKANLYPISVRYEPSVNPNDRIAFVGYTDY